MTGLWVAAAFVAGVVVGVLWRESYEIIRGREDPMRFLRLSASPRTLAGALAVSLVMNTAVGVMVIINDRDARRDDVCTVTYNRLTGQARDERVAAQTPATAAELARERLKVDGAPAELLRAADRAYLRELEKLAKVRAATPYPPPDFCVED